RGAAHWAASRLWQRVMASFGPEWRNAPRLGWQRYGGLRTRNGAMRLRLLRPTRFATKSSTYYAAFAYADGAAVGRNKRSALRRLSAGGVMAGFGAQWRQALSLFLPPPYPPPCPAFSFSCFFSPADALSASFFFFSSAARRRTSAMRRATSV